MEGAPVVSAEGARVGRLEGLYADGIEGLPLWLMANARRFSEHPVLIPTLGAAMRRGILWTAYEWPLIREAVGRRGGDRLTRDQELGFCTHYDLTQRIVELVDRPEKASTAVRVGMPRERGRLALSLARVRASV